MKFSKIALLGVCVLGTMWLSSCDKKEVFSDRVTVSSTTQVVQFYREIVNAIDKDIRVKSIANTESEGCLMLSDGSEIRLKKGLQKHENAPELSVRLSEGQFYWTITEISDGNKYYFLKDDDGRNLRVLDAAPKLKAKDGYWVVSVDDGASWRNLNPIGETYYGNFVSTLLFREYKSFVEVGVGHNQPRIMLAKEGGALISVEDNIRLKSGEKFTLGYMAAANVAKVSVVSVTGGHAAKISGSDVVIDTADKLMGKAILTLGIETHSGGKTEKTVELLPAVGEVIHGPTLVPEGVLYSNDYMFSIKKKALKWSTDTNDNLKELFKQPFSRSDGMANLEIIQSGYPTNWQTKFPAFGFIKEQNSDGWFLPSSEELRELLGALQKDFNGYNQRISTAGGDQFFDNDYYWTSSKSSIFDVAAIALMVSYSGSGSRSSAPSYEELTRLIRKIGDE